MTGDPTKLPPGTGWSAALVIDDPQPEEGNSVRAHMSTGGVTFWLQGTGTLEPGAMYLVDAKVVSSSDREMTLDVNGTQRLKGKS